MHILEDLNMERKMDKVEWEAVAEDLKRRLSVLQQQMRSLKIPMVIVFEGWGASGKGNKIARLIANFDPRGFSVNSMLPPTAEERRYPWMKRYWEKLPLYGDMTIFDRSWYQELTVYEGKTLSKKEKERRYEEITDFERLLTDDGYVLLKFFLHITKKEQKKRFKSLEAHKETRWRVTKSDWAHHEKYEEYRLRFDEMIERTNLENAPWTLIEADDKYYTTCKIFTSVIQAMEKAIADKDSKTERFEGIRVSKDTVTLPIPLLVDIKTNQPMEDEEYRTELKKCQKRLFELHNQLYQKKIPLILGYEGWDAAGKGGNIKRVTQSLDPRGYLVIPIAAPTPPEKNRQYLWRFWNALPHDGHIAIFDRTWYGRVLVEHVEGFCTEQQWGRAYDEINRFEKHLSNWGAIILKFWLHIDKEEQLRRFEERQRTPEKQYKITEEDWRNREKWDAYEQAVNEMLMRTNTAYAPWIIVESDNKKFARIKALHEIITAIEARL